MKSRWLVISYVSSYPRTKTQRRCYWKNRRGDPPIEFFAGENPHENGGLPEQ